MASTIVACSSGGNNTPVGGNSNTSSNSSSNATNTGTDTSTGTGTSTGSSSSVNVANATCDSKSPLLVDDMSAAQTDGAYTTAAGGGVGSWYTYSDRTIPISEPPVPLTTADGAPPAGSITPTEGDTFPANAVGPGMIANAREAKGGGENNWGAGFGFDFIDAQPDGGPVVFDQCEGGTTYWDNAPDAGSTGIPMPYDASAHKGVTFWAISNTGSTQSINVQFSDKDTSPWGGKCDPCVTTGPTACADDYLIGEIIGTTWKQYTIHWTDLQTQNWTKQNLPKGMYDSKTMYYMHFQFSTKSGTALKPFDLSVACIQFVDQ